MRRYLRKSPLFSRIRGRMHAPLPVTRVRAAYPDVETHVLNVSERRFIPSLQHVELDDLSRYLTGGVYQTPEVFTAELPDVRLCPVNNIALTANREALAETTGPGARAVDIRWRQIPARVTPVEGLCTLLRCPYNTFYHLIIDNLTRFSLLHRPYFRRYERIRLLVPGGLNPLERYFLSRLCPDNVEVVNVRAGRLLQPERYLYLSFVTAQSVGYVPAGITRLIRQAVLPGGSGRPRRLIISRERARMRRITNHAALAAALRPMGFEEVVLEALPIEEQIRLFRDAEIVVAPHGAGLANLLFAPHTRVLELFGTRCVSPHFAMLSAALGHPYACLCRNGEIKNHDFTVEVSRVLEAVRRLLARPAELEPAECVA